MEQTEEMKFQKDLQSEQIANDPNSVYADSMRENRISNIISQLNPENLLSEIEHRIRGEKKNQYTEEWEPINKDKPIVSEKLVQNYISFLNVYLTQNNSLSNYSSQEINNIMSVVIDYVKDDLSDNAESYGLTTKSVIKMKRIVKIMKPIEMEGEIKKVIPIQVSLYRQLVNRIKKIPNPTREEITKYKYVAYIETPVEVEEEVMIGDELTDYNQFSKIGHMVCQSTFSVLKQAQNGMLASRVFKALRVTGSIDGEGAKSKMDFMKFW